MDQSSIQKRVDTIESYLLTVGSALPAVAADVDLPKYIRPMLIKDTKDARLLRQAFGLPLNIGRAHSLMATMSLKERIAAPLISMIAQRLYHFIWRFQFTLRELNDLHDNKSELQDKVAKLCTLCLQYALAQRPSLQDLAGSTSRPIPESAADPSVYAMLRALEYEREEMQLITTSELDGFRKPALALIHGWLTRVLGDKQKADDYSNAWWALREGLCADGDSFSNLVGPVIKKFGIAQPPPSHVINKSFVPEIYDASRCAAYIIANIHAIIREGPPLEEALEKDLDTIVNRMVRVLMEHPDSKNLYLASVYHEGLTHVLSFSAEKQFRRMRREGKINLADFKPVGDFVCVEPEITRRIGQLKDGLKSAEAKKTRTAVLFYGASSTGKSFLVEQFFREFGRDAVYSANQFICKPETKVDDVKKFIAGIATSQAAGTPTPFILLDEIDVEMTGGSLYPNLLDMLDKGFLEKSCELSSFVLFLAGGKHGSVEEFRKFLVQNQKKKTYQKGIDVYNRIAPSHKIGLPGDLYRNKNLRMMVGLSVLLQHFGAPAKVSTSVLLYIREMRVDQGEGVRQFKSLKDDVKKDANGNLVLTNDPNTTSPIILVASK